MKTIYANTIYTGSGVIKDSLILFDKGKITGIETLNHELQHATDFSSGMYSRIWNGIGNNRADLTKSVMEFRAFYLSYQRTGLTMYQTSYQHWYNNYFNLLTP